MSCALGEATDTPRDGNSYINAYIERPGRGWWTQLMWVHVVCSCGGHRQDRLVNHVVIDLVIHSDASQAFTWRSHLES
eukprot:15353323-Alexandrium_andersonii.AAC.1